MTCVCNHDTHPIKSWSYARTMSRKLNWSRARKSKADLTTDRGRWLERRADQLIEARERKKARKEAKAKIGPSPSSAPVAIDPINGCYYRSVGSVMERDGRWHALDGSGQIVGIYPTRRETWQHADKFGLEICGSLPTSSSP